VTAWIVFDRRVHATLHDMIVSSFLSCPEPIVASPQMILSLGDTPVSPDEMGIAGGVRSPFRFTTWRHCLRPGGGLALGNPLYWPFS
jgi:hypothetical protein